MVKDCWLFNLSCSELFLNGCILNLNLLDNLTSPTYSYFNGCNSLCEGQNCYVRQVDIQVYNIWMIRLVKPCIAIALCSLLWLMTCLQMQMSLYAKGVSVLMPGHDFPTFIAHPAPAPCPPERMPWPSHQAIPICGSTSNPQAIWPSLNPNALTICTTVFISWAQTI